MVSYKQRYDSVQDEKKQLDEKVEMLEKLVLELGGVLPTEETRAKAKEAEAHVLCDREEEATAMTALTMDDKKSKKSKLI